MRLIFWTLLMGPACAEGEATKDSADDASTDGGSALPGDDTGDSGADDTGGGEETATVQKSERTNVSLTSRADTKTFAPLVKCRQLPNSLVKSS